MNGGIIIFKRGIQLQLFEMEAHHWNVVAQKERPRLMFLFLKLCNFYPTQLFSSYRFFL